MNATIGVEPLSKTIERRGRSETMQRLGRSQEALKFELSWKRAVGSAVALWINTHKLIVSDLIIDAKSAIEQAEAGLAALVQLRTN
jgi:hypothetical protein